MLKKKVGKSVSKTKSSLKESSRKPRRRMTKEKKQKVLDDLALKARAIVQAPMLIDYEEEALREAIRDARPKKKVPETKESAASLRRQEEAASRPTPRRKILAQFLGHEVLPKLRIPVDRYAEKKLTKKEKQDIFIEMYREFGNMRAGLRFIGESRETIKIWREDEVFRKRMEDAWEDSVDELEMEAWRRAVAGDDQIMRNFRKTNTGFTEESTREVRSYSDTLLMTMLSAQRPEKFGKRKMEVSGPDGGPIPVSRVERVLVDPVSVEHRHVVLPAPKLVNGNGRDMSDPE